jgi:hypothetical protein
MKYTLLISAQLNSLSQSACDRPTVVSVPASPVAVPWHAGAEGANGRQRDRELRWSHRNIGDRQHGHRDVRSFNASKQN